jgi:hypothetical protein
MRRARRLNRPGLPGSSESAVLLSNDFQEDATLNLDFRTGILDPRIDFQRTTTGTYYRGPFNQNLLLRSQEFDVTAIWSSFFGGTGVAPIRTANNAVAPDGTTTADTIVFNTAAGTSSSDFSSLVQNLSGLVIGQPYTFSIWLRGTVGGEKIVVRHVGQAAYTLLTLTTGWQRFIITEIAGAATIVQFGLRQSVSGHGIINANPTVEVWGAQLTEGSLLTPYIPTTTAAITQGQIAAAGIGVPRFENDPITGEARGLLIEGGATNLQLYSADITNGAARTNITIGATKITAPDGTTSGELVSATTTGATSLRGSTHAIAGTNATGSIFIKQGSLAVVQFWIVDSTTSTTILSGTYTFATKATAITSGTGTMTATDVGNGWVRIALSVTTFVSGNNLRFFYGFNGGTATAGDSFYLWGIQIEQQSFASSYIPTTTATVARGADSALMTGTNFSSWYNQAEGTVLVSHQGIPSGYLSGFAYQIDNNSNAERLAVATNSSTSLIALNTDGNVAQWGIALTSVTLTAPLRVAHAYAVANGAASYNGLAPAIATSGTIPTPTQMSIGSRLSGNYLNTNISRLAYWPTRLPNATMQAITA